jgi:hypothetical protein
LKILERIFKKEKRKSLNKIIIFDSDRVIFFSDFDRFRDTLVPDLVKAKRIFPVIG